MTMKKHAATLLILMVVGLTELVNAQMPTIFKAQVPFEFVANGKTIPAGECIIEVLGNGQTLLSISSGKQHAYALFTADEAPNGTKETALVFHQYGGRYFLASIKTGGRIDYQLPANKLERELQARNVAEQVFTLLASAK